MIPAVYVCACGFECVILSSSLWASWAFERVAHPCPLPETESPSAPLKSDGPPMPPRKPDPEEKSGDRA